MGILRAKHYSPCFKTSFQTLLFYTIFPNFLAYWGTRHTFTFLSFLGLAVNYCMRVNMSVAIVAMVKQSIFKYFEREKCGCILNLSKFGFSHYRPKDAYNYFLCLYIGNDNDSSNIGTECPMRNETDDNSGPVR